MTQVWMIRNSDTDIHLFNRYEHLRPSVEISFSACSNVKIETVREPTTVTFTVSAELDGKPKNEVIVAQCFHVWTEPSHL
jgi:hypothetical protein